MSGSDVRTSRCARPLKSYDKEPLVAVLIMIDIAWHWTRTLTCENIVAVQS